MWTGTDVLDLEANEGPLLSERVTVGSQLYGPCHTAAAQTSPQRTEEMAKATYPLQPRLCKSLTELATLLL